MLVFEALLFAEMGVEGRRYFGRQNSTSSVGEIDLQSSVEVKVCPESITA